MIRLLKCEYLKTRRRHIFLTSLAITVLAGVWAFHGKISEFILNNGYSIYLYQMPMVNSIFFPLLSVITASMLCDIEHKGSNFKLICTMASRGKIFDAKLICGLAVVLFDVLLLWLATIVYGMAAGFREELPLNLYALYLLFTLLPTAVIYIFQHSLSMLFKNQAIPFFTGILGEFAGLFSMFLPQYPLLRNLLPWGYYGALQFVGMFGWTKETRNANVYFEVMGINWGMALAAAACAAAFYLLGRYLFCKKEI